MLRRICKKISPTKKRNSSKNDFINPFVFYKLTKNKECPICWTSTKINNIEIIFPFNCRHFICFDCFKKWAKTINNNSRKRITDMCCPLCRKIILPEICKKSNLKKTSIKLKNNNLQIWY